jgi:hypothetical protein
MASTRCREGLDRGAPYDPHYVRRIINTPCSRPTLSCFTCGRADTCPSHRRSDPKPLPSWVPPELEPEYRKWQEQLDDYIKQWSAAVDRFI